LLTLSFARKTSWFLTNQIIDAKSGKDLTDQDEFHPPMLKQRTRSVNNVRRLTQKLLMFLVMTETCQDSISSSDKPKHCYENCFQTVPFEVELQLSVANFISFFKYVFSLALFINICEWAKLTQRTPHDLRKMRFSILQWWSLIWQRVFTKRYVKKFLGNNALCAWNNHREEPML